jgi:hypothetical protein
MAELAPSKTGAVFPAQRKMHWEYFGAGGREVVCLLNGVAMSTRS